MALSDTYHAKLQEFVALQKPDKIMCYQELTGLHAQLHVGKDLALPSITPVAVGAIYDTQIVGVYYAKSGPTLKGLPGFTELDLNPNPHNPADVNAIKVVYRGTHLGYLPKTINQIILSALKTKREVICLMGRHIPAVEQQGEFSPERATITVHIVHPTRFQRIFINLMDIYGLTFPNLPSNWLAAMVALGEVVIPLLGSYLGFHPELSTELLVQVKNQFLVPKS